VIILFLIAFIKTEEVTESDNDVQAAGEVSLIPMTMQDTQSTPPPTYSVIFDNLDFFIRTHHQSIIQRIKADIGYITSPYKTGSPHPTSITTNRFKTSRSTNLRNLFLDLKLKHTCEESSLSLAAECYQSTYKCVETILGHCCTSHAPWLHWWNGTTLHRCEYWW